jgi:hypothetical protein
VHFGKTKGNTARTRWSAGTQEMDDEENDREDQEHMNEEACDVKRNEGNRPYKNKQQSKSKKDAAHPSPPTL